MAAMAATSSDRERYFAKGPAPLRARARQMGHSIIRAIKTDLKAGVVMAGTRIVRYQQGFIWNM
jgi:hypothetical protein